MFDLNSWLASLMPPNVANTPTYIFATAHPWMVYVVAALMVFAVWGWLNEQEWGQKLLADIDWQLVWVGGILYFSSEPRWLMWIYVMWRGTMVAHAKSTERLLAAIYATRQSSQ